MDMLCMLPSGHWGVVDWHSSLGTASAEDPLIQGPVPSQQKLTANNSSRATKALLLIPTLKDHLLFRAKYWVSWGLIVIVLQPNFSLCTILLSFRGWSQDHFLMNLLHANPHHRFPGKLTLQHIFKRKLLVSSSVYFSIGWNTERVVVSELWPYEWGKWLIRWRRNKKESTWANGWCHGSKSPCMLDPWPPTSFQSSMWENNQGWFYWSHTTVGSLY